MPPVGIIGIYVKGKRVAKISLTGKKLLPGQKLLIATVLMANARIVIKVETPGKGGVYIDGFALLK